MIQVLKIKIHQPNAHYRVPFSYQRRFTYPIPPYSTVKGLICNLLGIKSDSDERFAKIKGGLSLAIYGRYESLVKEYTWFRNLLKKSHIERFHTATNRYLDRIPQHPGGQMPVTVDVLNNVNLIIYLLYNPDHDDNFLETIKEAFENPSNRVSTIHLGRAEDWLVFEEIKYVELKQKKLGGFKYFAWIPEKKFVDENFIDKRSYDDYFQSLNANLFKLPTFYEITGSNQRIFNEYVTVKLYEGGSFKSYEFYVDESENIPIIFSKLNGGKDARVRIVAKSKKTITLAEHTAGLLDQLKKLKCILCKETIDYNLLEFAIFVHDLGKVSPTFQLSVGNWDYSPKVPFPDVAHSLFSLLWINKQELSKELSNEHDLKILLSAVAFHHWRDNFHNIILAMTMIL